MNKLLIPFIVFIGISMSIFAQEKSHSEVKGDKYYTNYTFDKAIYSYTHTKNLSTEGVRRLAASYYNMDQIAKSEAVYSKLLSSNGVLTPEDYFNYSMVLKANGKYYESDMWMKRFAELAPNDLRTLDYQMFRTELKNLLHDNGNYTITSLKFNTSALDFGPSFYQDKIVFSSTREGIKLISRRYNWTNKPYWDIYVSELDGIQLKKPTIFDKSLNGKLHDGPVSFAKNGTMIAFTRNHYNDTSKDNVVELQIYFSSLVNGKWSEPVPFPLNNEGYSVGHPCLSADGNTMYFASDMPGGFGKADIYRITRDANGTWGKAENLGSKVNTEGDELYPYYKEDSHILFFSSNGRYGLGGLDIFIYAVNSSGAGLAYNAGAPLNTQYDDFAVIADDKVEHGYFTSNRRDGKGGDDLYSVTFNGVPKVLLPEPDVAFVVYSPKNIPTERKIRETFPIRNFIYFDKEPNKISDRYVLLKKSQVKDFKEAQLEVFAPVDVELRSKRQMVAYYNVLNILGDRMNKNPSSTILLVGSSGTTPEDGQLMAESVKTYLVDIFGIDPNRISIDGRIMPKVPFEKPGGTDDLELLRAGDRRVTIESTSPEMLMEFQSGPNAPLKPIEITTIEEAPLDSYVSFTVDGANEALDYWSLEIKDNAGRVQNFGRFYKENTLISGKAILGDRQEGNYQVTMIGITKKGNTLVKDTTVHMNLWTPSLGKEGLRFSIIFEFDDSRAIQIYEKYLSEIVVPKIPMNAKVIIHGHTDITGPEAYNQKLSEERSAEVKSILKNSLEKLGRTDVTFEVYSFGENLDFAPFRNKYPEDRAYNRTVIIDIIPAE